MSKVALSEVVYDETIYPRAEWSLSSVLAGEAGAWRATEGRPGHIAVAHLAADGRGGWAADVAHLQADHGPFKNTAEGYFSADVIGGLLRLLGFDNPEAAAWKRAEPGGEVRSVYFIEAENGLIKIGVSDDPVSRFGQIRTMSPLPLRLRGVVPGAGNAGEAELHQRFAADRAHGEWFRPSPALLSYIAANAVEGGSR